MNTINLTTETSWTCPCCSFRSRLLFWEESNLEDLKRLSMIKIKVCGIMLSLHLEDVLSTENDRRIRLVNPSIISKKPPNFSMSSLRSAKPHINWQLPLARVYLICCSRVFFYYYLRPSWVDINFMLCLLLSCPVVNLVCAAGSW